MNLGPSGVLNCRKTPSVTLGLSLSNGGVFSRRGTHSLNFDQTDSCLISPLLTTCYLEGTFFSAFSQAEVLRQDLLLPWEPLGGGRGVARGELLVGFRSRNFS